MTFGLVVFLSAFLLFQLQLIVAKHVLPWFGGSPAVWTTSQMFFQILLLVGYGYAHVLTQSRQPSRQYRIHVWILAAALVSLFAQIPWGADPLLAPGWMRPDGTENPVALLLVMLTMSVALPFFALSTTAPLLQRWHSRTSESLGRTYRLYALSNLGSFLGLLSYPFGIERLLDLTQQAWVWTTLFVLFAIACALVARRTARHRDTSHPGDISPAETPRGQAGAPTDAPVGPLRFGTWLFLSFITSVMFLATTNQLTQDVAAVPFLWVLPLAIYLVTFIICFDRPEWYSRRWTAIAVTVTSIAVQPAVTGALDVPVQVAIYSAFLFSFCMLCHGELVRLRPGATHLTLFYLVLAFGGALGGTFVSLAAPALFPDLWEFQAAIIAGWLVVALAWWLDTDSPMRVGDRGLFAAVMTIALWLGIRFLIERTRLGRIDTVEDHGWALTFLGGGIVAVIACAALWRTRVARWSMWPKALILVGLAMSTFFLVERIQSARAGVIHATRNFYGVVRVLAREMRSGELRELRHGTTTHGVQLDVFGMRPTPTAYYSPSSGIAVASTRLLRATADEPVHFGIVGMGIGTMSGFARAGDRVRYYEINPAVIDLVQGDEPFFTYIKDSPSVATIVPGDARLALERELATGGSEGFDLLVMDAFASDSVPMHLVTVEAFRLYTAHLNNERSILAVNVTNRYLDLEPVVAANAAELGFSGVRIDSEGDAPYRTVSSWILLTRQPSLFKTDPVLTAMAKPLGDREVRFTDKYSNLFRILYTEERRTAVKGATQQ